LNDGSSDYWITHRDYEPQYYTNLTDPVAIPDTFAITDVEANTSSLTGTATSTSSTSVYDVAALYDTTATFSSVSPGDLVHNLTDSSHGVVVGVFASSYLLNTAMFYGTNNYFTLADSYLVNLQGRKRLVFSPPPSTSGYTVTVPYVRKPAPVYTDYGMYPFDPMFSPAFVKYAAWLAKYRDREPNYGDAWYKYWLEQIRIAVKVSNKALDRTRFKVQMIKRSLYDRSYR
jgi:hypothetical protein